MRTFAIVTGITIAVAIPALYIGFLIWFGLTSCPMLDGGTYYVGCN